MINMSWFCQCQFAEIEIIRACDWRAYHHRTDHEAEADVIRIPADMDGCTA